MKQFYAKVLQPTQPYRYSIPAPDIPDLHHHGNSNKPAVKVVDQSVLD